MNARLLTVLVLLWSQWVPGFGAGVGYSDHITTAVVEQTLREAWTGVTGMSGTLVTEMHLKDWPVYDDSHSSEPTEVLSGLFQVETTAFVIGQEFAFIDKRRTRRGKADYAVRKIVDNGKATLIRMDTSPTLYQVNPGKLTIDDVGPLVEYFSAMGIVPAFLPLSETQKDGISIVPPVGSRQGLRVEPDTFAGTPVWAVRIRNQYRILLDLNTLTPLRQEVVTRDGTLKEVSEFRQTIDVPGSKVRMPMEIHTSRYEESARGHSPTCILVRRLEHVRMNQPITDQDKRVVLPSGAKEVEARSLE